MRVFVSLVGVALAIKFERQVPNAMVASAQQQAGFLAGMGSDGSGKLPAVCKKESLTPEQRKYVDEVMDSFRHGGQRATVPEVYQHPLQCWYASMLESDCGGLKSTRASSTTAKREMQEFCMGTKGYKSLFTQNFVTEEERMYFIKHFPNQKDINGKEIESEYSEVMNTLSKMAGKEAFCLMLQTVDDGCKDAVFKLA